MNEDELRRIQDAIDALGKAARVLEELSDGAANSPVTTVSGTTMWFACRCGTPVNYGDQYCRMCGRRIRWQ